MNLTNRIHGLNRLHGLLLALLFGLSLGATSAVAHPGHSTPEGTPWYRYLPPGTPAPALPTSP